MKKCKGYPMRCLGVMLLAACIVAGCGRMTDDAKQTVGVQDAGDVKRAIGVQDASAGLQADGGVQDAGAGLQADSGQTANGQGTGSAPIVDKSAQGEKVEYSHDDIYLSLVIPDGWDYSIKTAEDMEKYDGLSVCAIDFWKEEYPDTVFCLSYETFFGICGTGVTIDKFERQDGMCGYRYTEEIEDTLWLTIVFDNPANEAHEGSYCMMAEPKLSVWDVIEADFEQIAESIWVGTPKR